nr:hypothetical protein [Tanacetum cinerariifolium]
GIIANIDADKDITLQDVANSAKEVTDDAEIEETTEVVTAASATVTAADAPIIVGALTLTTAPSAARKRKGVVIRDPEEIATPSTIIHSEAKSKDKGKEILDDVIDQVQRNEKEDNAVMRYQALKRKPQTKAQARKNMMIYLRNMVGFKMDYFKGMTYDDIRPIFKKKFNSNKLDEEVEELRKHLQIVPNDDDDVYTEATPLALKIITFTTTQLILLVERKYPLTRFTLEQMLNNVRLEVEEESEISLELLRFIRQQNQEGFRLE